MNADLTGRQVALLLISQDAEGNDDWAVFSTTLQQGEGQAVLVHKAGQLELSDEWLSRIKATTPQARSILLEADFFLPLTVGSISDEEAETLRKTGFQWPTKRSEG